MNTGRVLNVLLIAAKINLNYMGQYKLAFKYATRALSQLNETIDAATTSTIEYVYAVCASKYADSHKYACEKKHLKEEARKHLELSIVANPRSGNNIYFLARELAEAGEISEAITLCEKALKHGRRNPYYLALYALVLTMKGDINKAYAVLDEECQRRKDAEADTGYILLKVIKNEIEIYQAMYSQQILTIHEKDCLKAAQDYRILIKALPDYQEEEEQKEEESKKMKENSLIMKTMKKDCLKNYEKLIRMIEKESIKVSGGIIKKYRIGDRLVESIVTLVAVLQYYVKACLKLGDIERAKAGYDKIIKDCGITSSATLYLVMYLLIIESSN